VDRHETTFGIRTIRFDAHQGFFLNGRKVVLKGTNNHQDHAGVGAALPDALQGFRVARLKEMGSNAYRASHNPPTPELLDACDRQGLLVIDEHRLMGSNPAHLGDLARLVRRDRNHPSVVLWSLGNEEWAIEGNVTGARIAATMRAAAHRLDPTRPTTVALSGGRDPQGISGVAEVMGFNYVGNGSPDEHRKRFPDQPGVGTEETTTQGTRGIYVDDRERAHLSPQADGSSKGNCEFGWQYYAARPHLAGLFYWTGFDYRGEPTPFVWPATASQFGILDLAGFPKDCFHYLRAWWTDADVLHVSPHWTWPGREGQEIAVRVDGNSDAVALWLNGRSLGRRAMPRNGHLEWTVRYAPGVLEARGWKGGREVARARVETAGAPAAVRLAADRSALAADGEDVAVLTAEVVDAKGRTVPTAGTPLTFTIEGGGRILGVGNGDPGSHEPDRFLDAVELSPVREWRGRIAPPGTAAPGEAEALPPLTALGHWQAVLPKAGEVYDLAASFERVPARPGQQTRLVLPSLGARTSVWLNDREIARDLDTARLGPDLPARRRAAGGGPEPPPPADRALRRRAQPRPRDDAARNRQRADAERAVDATRLRRPGAGHRAGRTRGGSDHARRECGRNGPPCGSSSRRRQRRRGRRCPRAPRPGARPAGPRTRRGPSTRPPSAASGPRRPGSSSQRRPRDAGRVRLHQRVREREVHRDRVVLRRGLAVDARQVLAADVGPRRAEVAVVLDERRARRAPSTRGPSATLAPVSFTRPQVSSGVTSGGQGAATTRRKAGHRRAHVPLGLRRGRVPVAR
jgi:hypothetical protein